NSSYAIKVQKLEQELASYYHALMYARQKENVYRELNELYHTFSHSAERRFELGESNYLEKITAQAKKQEIQLQYDQASGHTRMAYIELLKTVQPDTLLRVKTMPMEKLELSKLNLEEHVGMAQYKNQGNLFRAKNRLEKHYLLPDIDLNYFQGTNPTLGEHLYGFKVGLKIPLLFSGNASRIRASKIAERVTEAEADDFEVQLRSKHRLLRERLQEYETVLAYYEKEGRDLSQEIIKTATLAYQSGEIDYFQYILSMENGYQITLSYLAHLNDYTQTIIAINFLNL